MKLRLDPLLIPLAAVAVLTHTAPQITIAYASVAVHELAHLAAALSIGLRPESITLSPFGARLRLKNKIVRSFADEVILYAAGPLLNGIIAAVAAYLEFDGVYRINAALIFMNILPVPPLDGGMITKRIISARFGKRVGERVCACMSFTVGTAFLAVSIYGAYRGTLNPSMFIMVIFLFGSAVTGRELYNTDMIMGLSSKKRSNRAKLVMLRDDRDRLDAIKSISPSYTIIAAERTASGAIRLIDETELIDVVLRSG